jgi:hypothetical protein
MMALLIILGVIKITQLKELGDILTLFLQRLIIVSKLV